MARNGTSRAELATSAMDTGRELLARIGVLIDSLGELRETLKARPDAICVTNEDISPQLDVDFPAPGSKRLIVPRTATGGSFAIAASAAPQPLLRSNNRRIGGQIVNAGANPATLLLGDAADQGIGQIALPVGAVWNFQLAELLWAGQISVLCPLGTTLTIVEV